jgi:mRNA interferase RelE/StbE
MPDYSVTFSRSARKELENLPTSIERRILPKIESLSKNPHPNGASKLIGQKDMWRIRVGDYRVLHSISDKRKTVDIAAVMHRSEVYKNL